MYVLYCEKHASLQLVVHHQFVWHTPRVGRKETIPACMTYFQVMYKGKGSLEHSLRTEGTVTWRWSAAGVRQRCVFRQCKHRVLPRQDLKREDLSKSCSPSQKNSASGCRLFLLENVYFCRTTGRKKAHKRKLFALLNVHMALGQTAGCPRANRPKKFMCSPQNTGNISFSLWVTGGLSRLSKSLRFQSLCAYFLP